MSRFILAFSSRIGLNICIYLMMKIIHRSKFRRSFQRNNKISWHAGDFAMPSTIWNIKATLISFTDGVRKSFETFFLYIDIIHCIGAARAFQARRITSEAVRCRWSFIEVNVNNRFHIGTRGFRDAFSQSIWKRVLWEILVRTYNVWNIASHLSRDLCHVCISFFLLIYFYLSIYNSRHISF